MLVMVVERFKAGRSGDVARRFRERGRLIPEGSGLDCVANWMALDGAECCRRMGSPTREALEPWRSQ
ncbi:MAG: hypothetical protein FJ255_11230 [Phycisphaerae bacterium]|nr:hypothetical protein [Phycisphaerae bacterium]